MWDLQYHYVVSCMHCATAKLLNLDTYLCRYALFRWMQTSVSRNPKWNLVRPEITPPQKSSVAKCGVTSHSSRPSDLSLWSIRLAGTMWPPCLKVTSTSPPDLKVHRPEVSLGSGYMKWELGRFNYYHPLVGGITFEDLGITIYWKNNGGVM